MGKYVAENRQFLPSGFPSFYCRHDSGIIVPKTVTSFKLKNILDAVTFFKKFIKSYIFTKQHLEN